MKHENKIKEKKRKMRRIRKKKNRKETNIPGGRQQKQ
jgi:hypothetical protein